MSRAACKHGFTLVELLVVIGLIAVLMALLLPTGIKARRTAQKSGCLSNLQHIGAAIFVYGSANSQQYPYGGRDWQRTGFIDIWTQLKPSIGDERFYLCPSDGELPWNRKWARDAGPTFGLAESELSFDSSYFYYLAFFAKFDCGTYGTVWAGAYQQHYLVDCKYPARKAVVPCFAKDFTAHGSDGCNLLFADGHAQFTSFGDIQQPETPANEVRPNYNLQWTQCGINGVDLK